MAGRLPQPYHVYLDLDFINNDIASGAKNHSLVFEEIRNAPFLEGDCSNYFCSIVRFSIQTGASLPVFIPRIDITQTPLIYTIYKITLQYSTFSITQAIVYAPSNNTYAAVPVLGAGPVPFAYTNDYYFIYNYQDFIAMVNTCFLNAFIALQLAAGTALAGTVAPFIEMDPDTNKCILNADVSFYASTTTQNIAIYFNSRLFELFVGFQNTFISAVGDLNYLITVVNNRNTNLSTIKPPATGTTYTYCQMYQEISSVSMWNPIASLVFCSSMLPICPSQTSTPTIVSNQSDNLSSTGDNANLTSILSDFEIAISAENQYRPYILYAPTSEYRLVDMFSGTNLNRINISVFWKTHFGDLVPFKIPPGCAAHIKLMFRRKDFYIA
jgi:hypothetical protein